jgi:hypothetical protein
MTSIPNYLSEVYSEELFDVSESDYDEVMSASAVEDEAAWQGYSEWSASLEQSEFERELEQRATVATSRGPMLIKSECAHRGCGFTCKQAKREGGMEI